MINQDRNYSILIIEDSERDRLTYRRYLLANQNFKYQILEAQGLTEGLALWRKKSPDVLLVDINLPDGSGLELLKVVNNRYSRQPFPVIVISGQGNERIAVQAMKLGASDYLAKNDITASTLCQAVENALKQTIDVSDRKEMERALQLSEARFRRLFDANIVGMLFADLQGRIIDANDCFLRDLGYTRQELNQGLIRWDQITPSEYAQQDEELRKQIKEIGYFLPVEKEYYRKDGSRLAILLGGAFLPNSSDQTICIAVNISDRKLTEIKLQQLNQELARTTRLKDEFLANMSHELRTPLNAILGMTEGLKDQVYGPLNPQQFRLLQIIERSGLHLLELINDILDLAKIGSSGFTMINKTNIR